MLAVLPNIMTVFRICGSVTLIFIKPLTVAFFVLYTLAGISDALDGWVARRFNATSELGTKLDTVADFAFYTVMLFKILPLLKELLPREIWMFVSIIILVRIISYSLAALKYHRLATLHTYLNKLTGITLFFVPYLIKLPFGDIMCIIACAVAGIAAVEELIIHLSSKDYDSSKKSLLFTTHKKNNGAV